MVKGKRGRPRAGFSKRIRATEPTASDIDGFADTKPDVARSIENTVSSNTGSGDAGSGDAGSGDAGELTGYESISPAQIENPEEPAAPRKPRKYGPRATKQTETLNTVSVASLAGIFSLAHLSLAKYLHNPDCAIDDEQAQQLAAKTAAVLNYYVSVIDPKTIAIFELAATVAIIETPVIRAIMKGTKKDAAISE